MAHDSAQMWYAVPRTSSASSGSLSGYLERPSAFPSALPGPITPFFSSSANVMDSNENNAAHSGALALISGSNCNNVDANALVNTSYQHSLQHSVLAEAAHVDSMDCSGDNDPTSNSIAYALQLLGASRTSSCSTNMAWDDDEASEAPLLAVSSAYATTAPVAGASHISSNSTPRTISNARTCPAAPSRHGPSVRLVPAVELGVF